MDREYLNEIRAFSEEKLGNVRDDLSEMNSLFGDRASVYATGSFGRLDAGPTSDLDLFIISDGDTETDKASMSIIDEIKLKYSLINIPEKHNLPNFDGGGRFLSVHLIDSYTKWLGSQEDDYRNTLTGRMLMLLESRPLMGEVIYNKACEMVVQKYFRDFAGHEDSFAPIFLFNDILRMWRTFCVNYEFYRREGDSRAKLKNLKLKYIRLMTCYSSILYLLAVYSNRKTVSPEDVLGMIALTPVDRLRAVSNIFDWSNQELVSKMDNVTNSILENYANFLKLNHLDAREAKREYNKNEESWRSKSYEYGNYFADIINILGDESTDADLLRRVIMV